MKPGDKTGTDGQEQGGTLLSRETLHDIRTPLSVILGHVQLVQRRLHRGQTLDHAHLLQTLGYIEQAVGAIDAQLKEPGDKASPPARGADDE